MEFNTYAPNSRIMLNQYVKIKGYPDWFLFLARDMPTPEGLLDRMKTQIFRSRVCQLHHDTAEARISLDHQVVLKATERLDYDKCTDKMGSILIQRIGSYMPMLDSEVIDVKYDSHFPIEDFADIVICENDENCEYAWSEYLKARFPEKSITTINFFDLRDDKEVKAYFEKAKIITFSTTFSDFEWFEKLTDHSANKKIIGFCHNPEKWKMALEINANIEIVPTEYSGFGHTLIPKYISKDNEKIHSNI